MAFQDLNHGMFNGPIPGEGLTRTPGGAPHQNPPQFVHLDDLLNFFWEKFTDPDKAVELYALLKSGLPAEAIARTALFAAFCHGVCTVDLALLAAKTVARQIIAVGHLMGVKKMKIRNPNPNRTKFLAQIGQLMDDNDSDDTNNQSQPSSAPTSGASSIFSGLGL